MQENNRFCSSTLYVDHLRVNSADKSYTNAHDRSSEWHQSEMLLRDNYPSRGKAKLSPLRDSKEYSLVG